MSVGEDRQRITRERRLREYINLSEFVISVWHRDHEFALKHATRNDIHDFLLEKVSEK